MDVRASASGTLTEVYGRIRTYVAISYLSTARGRRTCVCMHYVGMRVCVCTCVRVCLYVCVSVYSSPTKPSNNGTDHSLKVGCRYLYTDTVLWVYIHTGQECTKYRKMMHWYLTRHDKTSFPLDK